jgi:hypothetical protein
MSTVALRSFETDRLALAPFHLVASPYRNLVAVAVRRWISTSSFGWAADRCKSVCAYLAKLRAGEEAIRPAWVSRLYLSYAERVAKTGGDDKFFQLLQVWRIFSLYGEGRPLSEADVRKFEHACLDGYSGTVPLFKREGVGSNDPLAVVNLDDLRGRRGYSTLLPEVRLPAAIQVRSPLALRSIRDSKLSLEWEEMRFDFHTLKHMLVEVWGVSLRSTPFALRQLPLLRFDLPETQCSRSTFGQIGNVYARVQKDGKARFFYAPPAWMQFLLEPWAHALYEALRCIPQDCTFDQEAGVRAISSWLRDGKEVSSIDLSSATDRFPLAVTRGVLKSFALTPNHRMWVDTFCFLSRVPVGVGFSLDEETVSHHLPAVLEDGVLKWEVGQPLGTVPSFAAFALSHHWLVRAAFEAVGYEGDVGEWPYAILGDDLVIADERVAQLYRTWIAHLGVQISEAKSLSGRLGEFAGRMISASSWDYKLKWPAHVGPRTLLSYVSLLGPRAVRGMKQSRLRDCIALIPTPRTPCGFNPGGFPKEQVDKFLTEYYYLSKDLDVLGELWVDPLPQVQARLAALSMITYGESPSAHCWTVAPRGAAKTGYGGAPIDGPRKGGNTWKWSPYLSRAWIQRVRKAAQAAELM